MIILKKSVILLFLSRKASGYQPCKMTFSSGLFSLCQKKNKKLQVTSSKTGLSMAILLTGAL